MRSDNPKFIYSKNVDIGMGEMIVLIREILLVLLLSGEYQLTTSLLICCKGTPAELRLFW